MNNEDLSEICMSVLTESTQMERGYDRITAIKELRNAMAKEQQGQTPGAADPGTVLRRTLFSAMKIGLDQIMDNFGKRFTDPDVILKNLTDEMNSDPDQSATRRTQYLNATDEMINQQKAMKAKARAYILKVIKSINAIDENEIQTI